MPAIALQSGLVYVPFIKYIIFYCSNIQKLKKQWELVCHIRLVTSGFHYDDNDGVTIDDKNVDVWNEFCKVHIFYPDFHSLTFAASHTQEHTNSPVPHSPIGSRWNH